MGASAIPNIVAIAGVDPSGGAGVLADVKAISANGAYACGVITALTAQNTQGVAGIQPVAPDFVQAADRHPFLPTWRLPRSRSACSASARSPSWWRTGCRTGSPQPACSTP